MPFAEVAVNSTAPHRQSFTYSLPRGLSVAVGQAVYVPFGSRTLQGVVLEVTEEPRFPETRDVIAVVEGPPLLAPERAALARWISEHYLAPLFDCVALMLPPGFRRKPLTLLRPLASGEEIAALELTPRQRQVLETLAGRSEMEADELRQELGLRSFGSVVDQLAGRGLIERGYELGPPKVRAKVVPHVRLLVASDAARAEAAGGLLDSGSGARIRARREPMVAALNALAEEGPLLPLTKLRAQTGIWSPGCARWRSGGWWRSRTWRWSATRWPTSRFRCARRRCSTPDPGGGLSGNRGGAERRAGESAPVFLLHGVTGSGKTEVYLQALEQAVAAGQAGDRAGAGDRPDAADGAPLRRALPGPGGRDAQRPLAGRAASTSGSASATGRYAVVVGARSAALRAAAGPGPDRHRRGARVDVQAGGAAPRYHARAAAEELAELTGAVARPGQRHAGRARATTGRSGAVVPPAASCRSGSGAPRRTAPSRPRAAAAVEVVDLREELKARQPQHLQPLAGAGVRPRPWPPASRPSCSSTGAAPPPSSSAATAATCPTARAAPSPSPTTAAQERLVCHHCNTAVGACRRSAPVRERSRIRLRWASGTERVEEEATQAVPRGPPVALGSRRDPRRQEPTSASWPASWRRRGRHPHRHPDDRQGAGHPRWSPWSA